jgi:hypothetical protein
MNYEKPFNETDPLNEGEDDEVPQIIHRSSPWTKRAIICLSLLVIIQTVALLSLVGKSIVRDPLLALWCECSSLL